MNGRRNETRSEGEARAVYLAVRLQSDRVDLHADDRATRLWSGLRRRFRDVLIVALLRDRVHLLVQGMDPAAARHGLAKTCADLQRGMGLPPRSWEPVPPPTPLTDAREIRRYFRAIARHESRGERTPDPLQSLWSTYRELFGAVDDPWIDRAGVLEALDLAGPDGPQRVHAFTSGHPVASPQGTAPPRPAMPTSVSQHPLGALLRAAASATRSPVELVRRRSRMRKLFVWLARDVGWWQPTLLAEVCGVTPDAIHRIARNYDARAVRPALVCLGDERLLSEPLPDSLFARGEIAAPGKLDWARSTAAGSGHRRGQASNAGTTRGTTHGPADVPFSSPPTPAPW